MNRTSYQTAAAYGLAAQRAEQMGLSRHQFELLTGPGRAEPHRSRRAVLMKFLRELGYPLQTIGQVFNRDHTTVMHALEMKTDCEVGALA